MALLGSSKRQLCSAVSTYVAWAISSGGVMWGTCGSSGDLRNSIPIVPDSARLQVKASVTVPGSPKQCAGN